MTGASETSVAAAKAQVSHVGGDADTSPPPATKEALKNAKQDRRLRRFYAYVIPVVIAGQLAVTNIWFFYYGAGNDWDLPWQSVSAYMTATVVEIVAVVLVIARYLFPPRTGLPGAASDSGAA